MARIISAVKAIALASWRDIQTFRSITGQNLFLFILLVGLQPQSAELFAILLGLVMIFPLSADPMEKAPADRWRLWPLSTFDRALVRTISVAFSPLFWIALVLLLRGQLRTAALFFAIVVSARLLFLLIRYLHRRSAPNLHLLRLIPKPPGIFGALMQLHWRETLTTLDPYVALLLAGLTITYRLHAKNLEPAAAEIMSLVSVMAMSTSAQVLIGLDGRGALRYRLVPLRGWQILLAKDLAWLTLLALLVAPLDFTSGFFAALAALTIGHYRSVSQPIPQARWRFTSGVIWPDGILQTIALIAVGTNIKTAGLKLAIPCLLCWLASVAFYGREWDHRAGHMLS